MSFMNLAMKQMKHACMADRIIAGLGYKLGAYPTKGNALFPIKKHTLLDACSMLNEFAVEFHSNRTRLTESWATWIFVDGSSIEFSASTGHLNAYSPEENSDGQSLKNQSEYARKRYMRDCIKYGMVL